MLVRLGWGGRDLNKGALWQQIYSKSFVLSKIGRKLYTVWDLA